MGSAQLFFCRVVVSRPRQVQICPTGFNDKADSIQPVKKPVVALVLHVHLVLVALANAQQVWF